MTCTDKCRLAKGDLCRCSCGGDNHGIDVKDEYNDLEQQIAEEKKGGEIIFRFKDPQKSILEFQEVKDHE